MDDHTLSVAVGVRLGTAICATPQCKHCDEELDCYGTHVIAVKEDITNMLLLMPLSSCSHLSKDTITVRAYRYVQC